MHLNCGIGIKAVYYDTKHLRCAAVETIKCGIELHADKARIPVHRCPSDVVSAEVAGVDTPISGSNPRESTRADRHVTGCAPAIIGNFEIDGRLRTVRHIAQILKDEAAT